MLFRMISSVQMKKGDCALVSFEGLQSRVNIADPVRLLVRRVLKELSEEEKYQLFTRPM